MPLDQDISKTYETPTRGGASSDTGVSSAAKMETNSLEAQGDMAVKKKLALAEAKIERLENQLKLLGAKHEEEEEEVAGEGETEEEGKEQNVNERLSQLLTEAKRTVKTNDPSKAKIMELFKSFRRKEEFLTKLISKDLSNLVLTQAPDSNLEKEIELFHVVKNGTLFMHHFIASSVMVQAPDTLHDGHVYGGTLMMDKGLKPDCGPLMCILAYPKPSSARPWAELSVFSTKPGLALGRTSEGCFELTESEGEQLFTLTVTNWEEEYFDVRLNYGELQRHDLPIRIKSRLRKFNAFSPNADMNAHFFGGLPIPMIVDCLTKAVEA